MASSILGRVSSLVRANINSILDSAEDPELMLDQLIRDFTENINEAEQAVAQTVGNLRMLEEDLAESRQASGEWGGKAQAAANMAGQLTGQGKAEEAARFEELAKVALRKQISFEQSVSQMQGQVTQQTELTDQLKDGLNKLRTKREELVSKRDELASRAKMAQAQTQVQAAVKNVSVMDPTSELNRFEDRIRREEAMARGMAEVSASSMEEQFASLEDAGDEIEVETRLAALKSGSGGSSSGGSSGSSSGSPQGGSSGSSGSPQAGSSGSSGSPQGGSSGSSGSSEGGTDSW